MFERDLAEGENVLMGDRFEVVKKAPNRHKLIDDISEVGDIITVVGFYLGVTKFECNSSTTWFYTNASTELKKITHGN